MDLFCERLMLYRRRNFEPQGGEQIERRACVTHKAFCHNCHLCQLLAFALVLLFSFTQKTALSSYISRYRSLVFCVWKPCGCSTSDCDVLLRSCHTKRRDIVRTMSLSMRVLSVVPRYALAVGSLKQSAEGEQR